jgi:hypothetical protein
MDVVNDRENSLTTAEQKRLNELEGVIRENFLAYSTVGNALTEIRENRLYRNREGRTWVHSSAHVWPGVACPICL